MTNARLWNGMFTELQKKEYKMVDLQKPSCMALYWKGGEEEDQRTVGLQHGMDSVTSRQHSGNSWRQTWSNVGKFVIHHRWCSCNSPRLWDKCMCRCNYIGGAPTTLTCNGTSVRVSKVPFPWREWASLGRRKCWVERQSATLSPQGLSSSESLECSRTSATWNYNTHGHCHINSTNMSPQILYFRRTLLPSASSG